jgi:hypothetical protein
VRVVVELGAKDGWLLLRPVRAKCVYLYPVRMRDAIWMQCPATPPRWCRTTEVTFPTDRKDKSASWAGPLRACRETKRRVWRVRPHCHSRAMLSCNETCEFDGGTRSVRRGGRSE